MDRLSRGKGAGKGWQRGRESGGEWEKERARREMEGKGREGRETDKWPTISRCKNSCTGSLARSLSLFRLRFIHFLILQPFSTHSAVAMATPAVGDYSRYQLKPSLINAGLSHFRNDAASPPPPRLTVTRERIVPHMYVSLFTKNASFFRMTFRLSFIDSVVAQLSVRV